MYSINEEIQSNITPYSYAMSDSVSFYPLKKHLHDIPSFVIMAQLKIKSSFSFPVFMQQIYKGKHKFEAFDFYTTLAVNKKKSYLDLCCTTLFHFPDECPLPSETCRSGKV